MLKRSFQSCSPATGAGGLIASGAGLIAVSYGMVRYGYGLQLPQLAAEFSLSSRSAGAIAAGSFAAYCLAALAAQQLIAWRGARVVLWLAAALAASGAVLVALSWSTPTLALGVLVAGSAAGAASPAMVVAVGSTVREPLVARAQAVVNAGTGAGVALVGAAVLAAPQAWRPVWLCAAAAALLAAATADRRATWPPRTQRPRSVERRRESGREAGAGATMLRPILAATVTGTGSAAVWTFGRDLITTTGGLPERTTAALWCLLGAAAVLGALSGDAVRLLGLRRAWVLTATLTATSTAVLALAPSHALTAAAAGAVFGGSYTALSGVLIVWASALRPQAAGQATATLFIALTAGQAVGAIATGALAERAGMRVAFLVCAAVLLAAAAVLPARRATSTRAAVRTPGQAAAPHRSHATRRRRPADRVGVGESRVTATVPVRAQERSIAERSGGSPRPQR